jgi:hypothetical protein
MWHDIGTKFREDGLQCLKVFFFLKWGGATQQGEHISLLLFFQNKESKIKCVPFVPFAIQIILP